MPEALLEHGSGTVGRVRTAGAWSVEVADVTGPDVGAWLALAEHWALRQAALDLRSRDPLPGSVPLVPGPPADGGGEHVRPVPVPLADVAATRALGQRVAGALRAGDLLVLSGPLGAGKTTFTQGLGDGLGVRGRVMSPTFVLARMHRGPLPLLHVDAYRLRDGAAAGHPLDLDDLDLDAALEDAVTVVEWGEGLVETLAAARLEVRLERVRGAGSAAASTAGAEPGAGDGPEPGRTALVRAVGARWALLG